MAAKQEVEVTYRELFVYIATVNRLRPKADDPIKTKLEYAIERNRVEVNKAVDDYTQLVKDINREQASIEKKDSEEFLRDNNGNLVFTKDANKNVQDEVNKLNDVKVKLNVYHTTAVPKNISPFTIETLRPIAIDPKYEIPDDSELSIETPNPEPQRANRP